MIWIKRTITVFVEVELPLWEPYVYTTWFFSNGVDEFVPVRGFDVPFDLVEDWNPFAIPPIDGELTNAKVSLAQFGLHLAPATQESSRVEHEPKPDASQAENDPMDIDLESIPEEEPEEVEPR